MKYLKYILIFALVAAIVLVPVVALAKKDDSTGVQNVGYMSALGIKSTKGKDGDINQSFLGTNKAIPRGIRNNNVGNLKLGSSAWKGKIENSKNTDQVFEQFTTYAYGIRAMIYLLINNYINKGYNTISKIINKYTGNNTSYMNYVSQRTGFGLDQVISPTKENIKKLVQAMAKFENGREAVLNSQFENGWSLFKNS